jgi:anti-sigma-K factor RskA
MNCEELRDMYELYSIGVLEDPEKSELDEHLGRKCEKCLAGMSLARQTNAALFTVIPMVEPPSRLRRKVLASVGLEKTGWGWLSAWAAVTAALMVAALYFSVQDSRHTAELASARLEFRATNQELTRVQAVMSFLNAPDTILVNAGKGVPLPPKARVFLNKNQGVLLLASNLPVAPVGKIYEMWVIPKGGAPKPAGLFQADAQGNAVHIQPGALDVDTTAVVAVTLEPEAGSQTPTMPIILSAGL